MRVCVCRWDWVGVSPVQRAVRVDLITWEDAGRAPQPCMRKVS